MKKSVLFAVLAMWTCSLALAGGDVHKRKAKKPGFEGTVKHKPVGEVAKEKKKAERLAHDEAVRRINQILKKKISFDFLATPLGDVLSFISALADVNIVTARDIDKKRPLTLRVNDMKIGSALQWIVKLAGAKMEVRDGAIYISRGKKADAAREKIRKVEALVAGQRRHQRMVGKAQLRLGHLGTVELYLYEDDLHPEIREVLVHLLRRRLLAELAELEERRDRGREHRDADEGEEEEEAEERRERHHRE